VTKSALAALAALALAPQSGAWRSSLPAGVEVAEQGGRVTIRNTASEGADLWREGSRALSGTYTVRATLRKLGGRQHEGYGLIFGGSNLGTDSARYSYVMIRGDGGVLVKKRSGAATPVVRDWARAAAVHPDDAQSRAENVLEVAVGPREVAVRVNGTEVARVPAAGLFTSGMVGLRVSHQMQVDAQGFDADQR
jgi:hypothetical protein